MKNANVFVDVDLTLIDLNGQLLEGVRPALEALRKKGCHLFLWSTNGAEYAKTVAARYRLTDFFEGYVAKPDIAIDDTPSSTRPAFLYNVHDEASWESLAGKIIKKHVD